MSWLIILIAMYFIYCGIVFFFQGALIFPNTMAGKPSDALPTEDTELIEYSTDEGTTVAWLIPAPDSEVDDDTTYPLAVFLHGNAELIDYQQPIMELYRRQGLALLLIEYRGYGHSDGTPSQQHIVDDAVSIIGHVLNRDEIDPARLVLHGRSIGGMLSAQVALQTKPNALIVESCGTSVADMSWRFGIPPFLVTSPLRTEKAFKQLDIPILIMHGKDDEIFPLANAHALDNAAKQSTLVVFDASHNTLPMPNEATLYEQSVNEHLKKAGVLR